MNTPNITNMSQHMGQHMVQHNGQNMGQNMQSQYGMNYQTNGMLPMPNQIMRPNNNTNGFNLGQNGLQG